MDPNVCRAKMIENANLVLASEAVADSSDSTAMRVVLLASIDLAEALHDLDEWLRSGGFFPSVWTRGGGAVNRGRNQDVDVSVPVNQPSKMVDDERPIADGTLCSYRLSSVGWSEACGLMTGHDGPHA